MSTAETIPADYIERARALRAKFFPTAAPVAFRSKPETEPDAPQKRQVREVIVEPPSEPEWDRLKAEADESIARVRGGRVSPRTFIKEFAELYGLEYSDFTGPSRAKVVAHARQDCMRALKLARPNLSLSVIAYLFGGRDHTTILHGIRASEERARVVKAVGS
jgi:hypothetical protein